MIPSAFQCLFAIRKALGNLGDAVHAGFSVFVLDVGRNLPAFVAQQSQHGHDGRVALAKGKAFLALEWWQYRWLGRFEEEFEIEVPAGDVAVIHAQPVKDVPSLVSVSHHFTGGYIVEDVEFDASAATLKGVLATKPGLRVVLFGSKGGGWKLARTASFHAMENSCGGWQSDVITTGMRTPFTIPFEKMRG